MSALIGKDVKVFEDGEVRGTFKKVTGYTGFSGNFDEQSGYYFPFRLTETGVKITIKKNGTAAPGKTDMDWVASNVLRTTENDTFEIIVDGKSIVTFTFQNAIFL